jgi:hypothetical protein
VEKAIRKKQKENGHSDDKPKLSSAEMCRGAESEKIAQRFLENLSPGVCPLCTESDYIQSCYMCGSQTHRYKTPKSGANMNRPIIDQIIASTK